jgi:hypothetical protein
MLLLMDSKKQNASKSIPTPEELLRAAEQAPAAFNIAAYFRPIYIMREKGHSWRDLEQWLLRFNIEMSHVHLRRLYIQEDKRLSKLTEKELKKIGMPSKMITEILEKNDPIQRLPAPDPKTSTLK